MEIDAWWALPGDVRAQARPRRRGRPARVAAAGAAVITAIFLMTGHPERMLSRVTQWTSAPRGTLFLETDTILGWHLTNFTTECSESWTLFPSTFTKI